MITSKKDVIFNGAEFNVEFLHNGNGECPYCFLNSTHQHLKGSNLKDFIMIKLPKEETWEDRFDDIWYEIQMGVSVGHPYIRYKDKLKDFIRREFI